MLVKLCFRISKCNPLRRSCVSIARNAGKLPGGDLLQVVLYRILIQRSRHGHLPQVVLSVLPQKFLTQRSCARCPYSSASCPIQTLVRRSWQRDLGQEIRVQRSCTKRILMQTSWQRDLAQEIRVQKSCASGHTRSWCRDSEILTQRYAQEIRIQRSCTSGPTGFCWGDLDTDILHKRSWYTDLAQVLLQDPAEETLTQTPCARGPVPEILHKWP